MVKRLVEHLHDFTFSKKIQLDRYDEIPERVKLFSFAMIDNHPIKFKILSYNQSSEEEWIRFYSKNRGLHNDFFVNIDFNDEDIDLDQKKLKI